jgi:small subunit ribosomal protein S9
LATDRFYGTGRRKSSVARVYLVPGNGKVTINKRDIDDYFGLETLKTIVRQPLVLTENTDKFDVLVNVKGGGMTGQAGAIRHGISRALLEADAAQQSSLLALGSVVFEVLAQVALGTCLSNGVAHLRQFH